MDKDCTLLGSLAPVDSLSNDFRETRSLGESIPKLFRRHGDLYQIRNGSLQPNGAKRALASRLVHPASGRILEVSTTSPYIQLYTGSALDGSGPGKAGVAYVAHSGLCLECEGYPDAPNAPHMGHITLQPGTPRHESTAYAFRSLSLSNRNPVS